MLRSENNQIYMVEGDYGIALPITLVDGEVSDLDSFKITIKDEINGEIIIEKDYSNITDNMFEFMLTREESKKLTAGYYVYGIDWYQDNLFMANLIKEENFIVEKKV